MVTSASLASGEGAGTIQELWNQVLTILSFGLSDYVQQGKTGEDIPTFLADRALNIILSLVGLVLLGYLIYGGFLWLTAAGDPQRLQKAQDTLVNALIGFVIIILAWTIVTTVQTIFGIGVEEEEEAMFLIKGFLSGGFV